MLDNLREPLIELATRQCFQHIEIINHQRGLMESTDQILPGARVHSSFPADRTIHHCQQSGWNLNMRNSTVINRRHESRNVADHPAAETNYKRLTVKPRSDHSITNRADYLERFRFLARRKRDQDGTNSI